MTPALLAAHLITITDENPPRVTVYGASDLTDSHVAAMIAAVGTQVGSDRPIGKIRVLYDGLTRRHGPGITYAALPGALRKNSEHPVFERIQDGKSFWVRLGVNMWAAEVYNGNKKAEFIRA